MTKTKLEQISKYIYDNGINLSSRTKDLPKDDENINENSLIDTLNIGVATMTGEFFIRANFRGSKKYFQKPILQKDIPKWCTRLEELSKEIYGDMESESDDTDF